MIRLRRLYVIAIIVMRGMPLHDYLSCELNAGEALTHMVVMKIS